MVEKKILAIYKFEGLYQKLKTENDIEVSYKTQISQKKDGGFLIVRFKDSVQTSVKHKRSKEDILNFINELHEKGYKKLGGADLLIKFPYSEEVITKIKNNDIVYHSTESIYETNIGQLNQQKTIKKLDDLFDFDI